MVQLTAVFQAFWKPLVKLVQVEERKAVVSIQATSRAWNTSSADARAPYHIF